MGGGEGRREGWGGRSMRGQPPKIFLSENLNVAPSSKIIFGTLYFELFTIAPDLVIALSIF